MMSTTTTTPPLTHHTQTYPALELPTAHEESEHDQRPRQVSLYSPRTFPSGITQPRLFSGFDGTGRHGFGSDLNPHQEYHGFNQDRNRLRTDHGGAFAASGESHPSFMAAMNPHASYPHLEYGFEHDRNNNDDGGIVDGQPGSLWLPEDRQHLTELHCFVRKHCVFVFSATSDDVGSE